MTMTMAKSSRKRIRQLFEEVSPNHIIIKDSSPSPPIMRKLITRSVTAQGSQDNPIVIASPNEKEVTRRADNSSQRETLVDQEFVGEFNCPICFDLLCMAVTTICNHSFCQPCLEEWLDSKLTLQKTCPACRKNLRVLKGSGSGSDSSSSNEAYRSNPELDDICNAIAQEVLNKEELAAREEKATRYIRKLGDKLEKQELELRQGTRPSNMPVVFNPTMRTRMINLQTAVLEAEAERRRRLPLIVPPRSASSNTSTSTSSRVRSSRVRSRNEPRR